MKRTIKISVIVLVLAVLLAALSVTMAACNKDKGQSVTEDYSAFAGKYYEVRAGKLSADSWFELKADGTWVDDTDESGIFKMNGNEIQMYWLTDEEPAFGGYIADGEMTLYMLGANVVYRQGTPTQDAGDDGPEEPQQPEADEYTITFSMNGGDSSIAPRRYKAGELLADLPIPTREGYNFLRWKDSMGRTYDRTSVMPAGDLYLTAVWEKKVSVYEDNYVMFKPAAQGKKHDNSWYYDYSSYGIDKYIYVELTSNDLGGRQNVGETNNFRLSELEFSVKSGYQWTWYSDDFNTVNGTQRFTLQYGSNIQFVTAQDASGNVQAIYLVDIYVKHDYKVDLYANKYVALSTYNVTRSYRTYWVVEGETVPEDVQKYTQDTHFTPAGFLYYNNATEKFEDYDLATPVRGDINLFQAYEDVKLTAELDDGTMEGELTIKPYTEFVQLPVPTKEGYDFIGWKMDNGKYFADITGNTTVNYLTQSNFFSTLTAEWRAKKYYEKWDGDEVTFVPTVPYVTYTNATQTSIKKIEYMPEGYDDIPDGTYIAVGEQLVATESDFCRWTVDGEKVSDEAEYTLQASDLDKTFKKELHVFDWVEDSPASCTKLAHHHKECANCDHVENDEDYGEKLPHNFDVNSKKCTVCNSSDFVTGDKLYFGEYPQTKETDNGITATLAQMSGNRPSEGNSGDWTDYGYYINGSTSEYMWYKDLEYGGARYRGVYFTSYRPYYTTYSSSTNNSEQDDHGYYINTLYWFKWEPIEWRVLEKTDGEAFLMSNVILDSQQYYRTDSGTRNIGGKTVYPNNYKESDIRAWLNGTFYNQAFDELEQSIIKTTLVDNSASTTASSSNSYACENTNDKVFLLSYKDVVNTNYGFNSSSSNHDTARRLKTTGYAQSQGAWTWTDSSDRGNGWWWLRSPYDHSSNRALDVHYYGYAGGYYDLVNYTNRGVVPAIKIQL